MTNPTANLGSATYFAFTRAGQGSVTDMSQYHRKITPRYNAPRKDTTTMGNSDRRGIAGFKENGYEVEGIWDTTIDSYYMAVLAGTSAPAIYGPAGSVSAKAKHSSNIFCTAYSAPANIDDAVTFTATWEVDGAVTVSTF